jgi:Holliday junction resolvase RusA-like endonuclease
MIFHAYVDKLPPSSNRIRTVHHGRIITTRAARDYMMYAYEAMKHAEPPEFQKTDSLKLKVIFYIPNLENKGWRVDGKGKAKFRYKKRDVSNMLKLLEDTVVRYLDVDDSQFLELTAEKKQGKEEGVHVWVERKSP